MPLSYVFIRDDDVWIEDAVFLELFECLRQYKIPVIYGVIPMRLTSRMAQILREEKQRDPELLDIVQHGYAHQNHAMPGEKKYEFGASRTYEQQYEDIAQGMHIMQRCFGRELTPGFIPPFHAEDKNTVQAIEALNMPLFSARKKVGVARKKFIDLPARVWLNDYNRDGTPCALGLRGLLARAAEALRPGELNGMVYRHNLIRTSSDMKAMKVFFRSLAEWRSQGKVRIVLFSNILSRANSQRRKQKREKGSFPLNLLA